MANTIGNALKNVSKEVNMTRPINGSNVETFTINYWMVTIWEENGDPRLTGYPLMSSFMYPLIISLIYYFIVLYAGPRFMKYRKPFSLKWTLIVYNIAMSLFNGYYFYKILFGVEFKGLCSIIFNIDYWSFRDNDEKTRSQLPLLYLYALSKYIEMLDTIFFVLRKKDNQITGLHVYHHSTVPIISWIYGRLYTYNSLSLVFSLINSPVHTIMYAYYGLAAIGPQMQPYLWWKRYITQFQIVQFMILITYDIYFFIYQIGYPSYYFYDVMFQSVLYLTLFTRLYIRSYKGENRSKEE